MIESPPDRVKYPDQRQLDAMTIVPANSGGFIVESHPKGQPDRGRISSFDFAGSLDDCLAYVRKRLSIVDPVESTLAAGQ